MRLMVLLLACNAAASGATGDAFSWQSLGGALGQGPSVQLVESDLDHMIVSVEIPGFWLSTFPGGGASWDRVELPDYYPQGEVGFPEVPSVPVMFAMPLGATATLTIEDVEYSTYDGLSLLPRQPAEIDMSHAPWAFERNERAYGLDAHLPGDWATLDSDGIWAGLHTSRLVVNPFRYNPARQELQAASSLLIRIDFVGGLDVICGSIPETVEPAMASSVINFGSFRDTGTDTSGTRAGAEYIVVCNDTNLAAVAPLFELHNWLGMKVAVEILPNPASVAQIFGAIADNYETGITEYALIVGDNTAMPAFNYGNCFGDYFYACLSGGDFLPELAIGRLTGTAEQVTLQVDKIINGYLDYAFDDANTAGITPSETVLAAHEEQYPGKYTLCCNQIASYPYSLISMTFTKVYPPEGGTAQTVSDAINNSIGTVGYRGHGGETYWAWSPGWTETNINALTNTFMPPVFNIACLNGRFELPGNCLSESWAFGTHGASGNLGATAPSYTEANHTYMKEIYKAIYDQGIFGIAAAINASTVVTIVQHASLGVANAKMYVWFGDPAMEIWSFDAEGEPGALTITGPSVLTPGPQSVTLTVVDASSAPVEGATVTLTDGVQGLPTDEQTFYEQGPTDNTGHVTFNITAPSSGVIHAGAFKHDYTYSVISWTIGLGVAEGDSGPAPALEMGLPVPNPVTVSASIEFSLPANGYADLSVYDIAGRRITTIESGEMSEGQHLVQWQPGDVASGVYFLRLTTQGGSVARQVMVVR